MSFPATDNFAGTGALSGNWTVDIGTASRVSGQILLNDSVARWSIEQPSDDQYCQIIWRSGQPGPTIRQAADSSGFYTILSNISGGTRVYKYVAPTFTNLGTAAGVIVVDGDLLRLEGEGTTLRFLRNGILELTIPGETTFSSGYCGVTGGNPSFADDWECGNLSGLQRPVAFTAM